MEDAVFMPFIFHQSIHLTINEALLPHGCVRMEGFVGGKGGRRLLNERAVIMPSLQDRLRFSETSVCQVAQLVCHIS